MKRLALLFVLFSAINLLCWMLPGPTTIVGDLNEQTGLFALVGFVLQPWNYLVLYALFALPESILDFFMRHSIEGAPLHLVVVPSIASTAVYEVVIRQLPRVPRVGPLVSRIHRAFAIA